MKVLVFTDEYDYSYYTFVYNEVDKLKEHGIETFVVSERLGKLRDTDKNYECIPFPTESLRRPFWFSINRGLFSISRLYNYYKERKRIIEEFKPDIIHIHFGDTAVRLFFPLEKIFKKYPIVISFHGFDASYFLNRPEYLQRLKILLKKPYVHVLYGSNHLKNNILQKGIDITKNSLYLKYGSDLSKFVRTKRENNSERIFIQISTFFEKKGYIYSILAFKKFLETTGKKAKLVLAGTGPLRDDLIRKTEELGLSDKIEFPGWTSREQIVEVLNNADYFVHHSVTAANGDQEGMPNIMIEAMAMELPVLATYHSGIPDIVEDGVNGYLVKEKDVDAYAETMNKVMDWTYLPESREKVTEMFSLDKHAEGLIDFYKKILAEKNDR